MTTNKLADHSATQRLLFTKYDSKTDTTSCYFGVVTFTEVYGEYVIHNHTWDAGTDLFSDAGYACGRAADKLAAKVGDADFINLLHWRKLTKNERRRLDFHLEAELDEADEAAAERRSIQAEEEALFKAHNQETT